MAKKLITDDNAFEAYHAKSESLRKQGLPFREIGQRLGVATSTVQRILMSETYEDYKEWHRKSNSKAKARREELAPALADARERDQRGERYSFGTKVALAEPSLEDKAWELVLANPDNEPLRKLAREISRRESDNI